MRLHQIVSFSSPSLRVPRGFARGRFFAGLASLAAVCILPAQFADGQELGASAVSATPAPAPVSTDVPVDFASSTFPAIADNAALPLTAFSAETREAPGKQPPESELIFEGLVSYGNYKIFASGYDEKLFTGGVEYDRHSWGYFLKAQVDYVGEFLPFVLLDKPLHVDIFGNPDPRGLKNVRQYVPGVGFSPIGFRLQWRSHKRFKPYLEAKGGVLVFTKKVPSSQAAYENFSLQSATGVQVKMNERWGLRLGLFSDFHFSDDFIVPVNPGLDVMNANIGISYHLGHHDN